jgi:transposase-like protein
MRNTYSPEFKAKVVREVLREDKTLSQVARRPRGTPEPGQPRA